MLLNLRHIGASPSSCTSKTSSATIDSRFFEGKVADGQSIFKTLEQVMLQVEYHCFADLRFNRIDPLYKEICLIIAEVLILEKDSVIKINGSFVCARLVQEDDSYYSSFSLL